MSTIRAFDIRENKRSLYRGKDFMKKLSTTLTEHAANVVHFEKKMLLLTEEELKLQPYITFAEKNHAIVILQVNIESGTHYL